MLVQVSTGMGERHWLAYPLDWLTRSPDLSGMENEYRQKGSDAGSGGRGGTPAVAHSTLADECVSGMYNSLIPC